MVMKKFMDDNFMLNNETAAKLFNDYAKDMPIFDYHCHLSPQMMYEDKPFENITQIFLGGDHYKWRYMRSNGIDESYITGDKSDYDKFKVQQGYKRNKNEPVNTYKSIKCCGTLHNR